MLRHTATVAAAALLLLFVTAPARPADFPTRLAAAGRQPRASVAPSGASAIVYGEGERILCRTAADGRSYGEPVQVAELKQLHLGRGRGPQVAASGASLVVTAIGKQGDLVSWRSSDGGRSFVGPLVVNDSPGSAREGLHSLAAGAGGSVHVVWLDLRAGRTQVYLASSRDGGRSFERNQLVYQSPDGTVCECCQPGVAADAAGAVAVQWRNLLAGNRDMYVVRSDDGGRTFGTPAKLGKGSWPLNACPMDGGGLAVRGSLLSTVWRREDVVYAAEPGGAERALGRGKNAVIALGAGGPYRAWQDSDGDVVLQTAGGTAVPVGRGGFPSFGAAPDGRGAVLLVWDDPQQGVMLRRLGAAEDRRSN